MKVISWNVNGYRAVWKKGFADWLAESRPDVMLIQETKSWAEQLKSEQLNPIGYTGIFSQPERKGYSGVATFSLKPPASVAYGYDIERFDGEGRVIITEHHGILIANIYFPNGKQSAERLAYKMDFYDATFDYFSRLSSAGKKIVVAGDYNTAHKPIDLARPKENEHISGFLPEERAWIDRWIKAGFIDIFRRFNDKPDQYTWWDMRTGARARNIGWRIDYFFVNQAAVDLITNAWISPDIIGSDHCPLGIDIAI